jgi:hypothetical protein
MRECIRADAMDDGHCVSAGAFSDGVPCAACVHLTTSDVIQTILVVVVAFPFTGLDAIGKR